MACRGVVSCRVVSCRAVLCCVVLCCAVLCCVARTMQCRALPCGVVSCLLVFLNPNKLRYHNLTSALTSSASASHLLPRRARRHIPSKDQRLKDKMSGKGLDGSTKGVGV